MSCVAVGRPQPSALSSVSGWPASAGSAEVREQIAEQFAKATELLEAATQATVRTKALEAEAASGPDELVRLEKLIAAQPSPAPSLAELPERIEEVRAVHREAETTAADARRRATRRADQQHHPDQPTRTLSRQQAPHHHGGRETLLHVVGRP